MPVVKLTAAAVPSLPAKADGRREVYRDSVTPGLLLIVSAEGGPRVFYAWGRTKTGRDFKVKLGRFKPEVFGLADARDAAKEVLRSAALGEDVVVERKRAKSAGTFGDLAKSYLKDAGPALRPTTLGGWQRILEGDRLSGLRSMKTSEITRGDIVRLLDRIRSASLARGGSGVGANRTLEVVRRVFSWGVEKDLIGASPVIGVKKPTKEKSRDRAYTDAELGAIVRALDEGAMCDAIRVCLLTGVRITQALGCPWSEVDLPGKQWTIAADRTGNKSGVQWLVPLVPEAVAVFERWAGDSPLVFATEPRRRKDKKSDKGHAWHSMNIIYSIRARSGVEDFRPHDLRRSLSSWLASKAGGGEPQAVRDAILGHRPPGLEGTYNVHAYVDEKRAALERWAAHVVQVAAAEPAKGSA